MLPFVQITFLVVIPVPQPAEHLDHGPSTHRKPQLRRLLHGRSIMAGRGFSICAQCRGSISFALRRGYGLVELFLNNFMQTISRTRTPAPHEAEHYKNNGKE